MARRPRLALAVLCLSTLTTFRSAAETEPPTPAQLAAMERVRPLVEAIWRDVKAPSAHPEEQVGGGGFLDVPNRLLAIGPDVVPFLVAEIELADPETFHFCAYTLGRLGGEAAEAALRKAVRAADARGGRFGIACKRYAVFGLALTGSPDVMDMMQTGEKTMLGNEMIPDFPQIAHMAILVGPAAAPVLDRQLASYGNDLKWSEKLENTLMAIGYAGDASFVTKLTPFLASPSPKIRVQAADAIARLAEPSYCDQIVPLLSTKDETERFYLAKSIERWKPTPCYKEMVGRLEVETDIGVRGALYRSIGVMGGESALEVFRVNMTGNEYDQAYVIKAISGIGSKKGLNMLRAFLSDPNLLTVVRAMEAIAAIGGESATDTLFAMTADRRRAVAASARGILAGQGNKKVAPRIAEDLLSMVREPVGNKALHVPISDWAEVLVSLGYTEPIEDLKKASAVQTHPEVTEILDSCVQRLQLIAKHRDDAAAWAPEAASPVVPVRKLADRRLAEIGSPAAAKALAARLAKTDITTEERTDILLAIANARLAGAAESVERHLADPAYDSAAFQDSRAAAAWAARRIGGDRMTRALRESAVRRDGRDFATLAYLAVVEKGEALPTLKTLRVKRLRYLSPPMGRETPLVEVLLSDLVAGRTPVRFDVPPDKLYEP